MPDGIPIPDSLLGRAFVTVAALGQEHHATLQTTPVADVTDPDPRHIETTHEAAQPILDRYGLTEAEVQGMALGLAQEYRAAGVPYDDAVSSAVVTALCVGVQFERNRLAERRRRA